MMEESVTEPITKGDEDQTPLEEDLSELSATLTRKVKSKVPIMSALNSDELRANFIKDISIEFNSFFSPINTFTCYISFL